VLAANSPVVMVTGGEDTMLKVTGHDFAGCTTGQGLGIGQHTLHGHPSTVKALCYTHIDGRWPILVSAGAKEAVMAWQLSSSEEVGAHRQFNSKLVCRWRPRKRSELDDESIDHRFHAVTAFPLSSVQPCTTATHVVAAGGTGSVIDLWCFDEERGQIKDAVPLAGHDGLVLCLTHCHLPIQSDRTMAFVACGTTTGSLYVWEPSGALNGRQAETLPALTIGGAHQSGVNCLCMASVLPNQLTIISGGDDQSINVSTVGICTATTGETKLVMLSSYRHPLAHVSGLKGMALVQGERSARLFSTSLDCRLHVWDLALHTASGSTAIANGSDATTGMHPTKVGSDVLSVADVSALAACTQGLGTNIDVVVVGHGLQAFRWRAQTTTAMS
jgi:WD40 repeat protein